MSAKITIHPDCRIADIFPRLFGAFLELIGSVVNGSMCKKKTRRSRQLLRFFFSI